MADSIDNESIFFLVNEIFYLVNHMLIEIPVSCFIFKNVFKETFHTNNAGYIMLFYSLHE